MKISTDVKNAPVSSTVNDCARGSPLLTTILSVIIFLVIITGAGGGGNCLITTCVCLSVSTTPLVL